MPRAVLASGVLRGVMPALPPADPRAFPETTTGMSLRGKIVLLFLCLAIVPLLVVAGFGYWQASKLATDVLGSSLEEVVGPTALQVDAELRSLDSRLDALARSPVTARVVAGDTTEGAWAAAVQRDLTSIAFAEVTVPGAGRIASSGVRPATTVRCRPGSAARLVTFRKPVRGAMTDAQLEVGIWMDDLIEIRGGGGIGAPLVFQPNDGTVLLSPSCETVENGLGPTLFSAIRSSGGAGSGIQRLTYQDDEDDRLAVLADLKRRPWSVVASTRTSHYSAPLQRLQASYSLFVLLLAIATGLAFSLFLGRVVQSLEELTRVAARIGEGELNPWLPPPSDDEVGRLSLAFSGMLERIRQMMQKVDQSGRLAVVGQLASYLAHEIRNPLSSIRMNLQSLQREVRRGRIPEDAGEAIDISLREVDRLSSSLTSVLQLGRPASGPGETVRVHEIVQEAAELLSGEFRRAGVEVSLDLDAAADRVVSIPGQLKGVFLNLMMNAIEAQPDGGRLDVRSRLISHPNRGPTVAVHLRDLGCGVPPELRDRIFEPFFSTRKQGSGIGLAVALRTVREHGGEVYLADLPESARGSEFVVELPLAAVVADDDIEPPVHLPPWMHGEGSERRFPRWSGEGETRRPEDDPEDRPNDANIRAFIALSESDQGKLH